MAFISGRYAPIEAFYVEGWVLERFLRQLVLWLVVVVLSKVICFSVVVVMMWGPAICLFSDAG